MPLVNLLRPGCFVGEKFPIKRGLCQSASHNRHGAPVGFEEKIHPLWLGVLIRVFQCEYPVGDDAELDAARRLYAPLERLPFRAKRKLVFVEKSDAVTFSAGEFNRHHHVGNQKRVLKEYPAYGTVLFAPRRLTKSYAKFLLQKCPTFIS